MKLLNLELMFRISLLLNQYCQTCQPCQQRKNVDDVNRVNQSISQPVGGQSGQSRVVSHGHAAVLWKHAAGKQ